MGEPPLPNSRGSLQGYLVAEPKSATESAVAILPTIEIWFADNKIRAESSSVLKDVESCNIDLAIGVVVGQQQLQIRDSYLAQRRSRLQTNFKFRVHGRSGEKKDFFSKANRQQHGVKQGLRCRAWKDG